MTANLVLHWHLDALTPENLAVDTSDNHLNGGVTGAPANQPDERFGSVLRLHGSPDALTVPDTPVLRLTTYTLEVWLNTMPVIPPLTSVIGKPPNDFRLLLNADGTIVHRFGTTANADDGHSTAAGLVTPGVWRHVAAVNDGHTASIYLDGKLVSSYAFTGDRVSAQVPLQVGEPDWYNGLLAHVRIYDGALTDVEIQRDMAEDEAALTAFVRAHPIDFALVSVDEQPVLFIDDAPAGQPMRLRITNTSRQDLEPLPLGGTASSANYNFALHLRPGTLAVPPEPKVLNAGWSLLREVDPVNGETVLYLASVDPPGIGRGGTYDLLLVGMSADGTGGTRGTRVELSYQHLRYLGEQDELTGVRIQFLDIVNHRGRREIPLAVGFVGGNRVLSDGATANTLRFRIANLSRDTPLSLAGASFTLSFDVQEANETHEWALVDAGHAAGASLGGLQADQVASVWSITPEVLGQRKEWTLTPQGDTAFGPDGSIVVTLSGVLALTSLGQAPIIIGYQNVPGYQDGSVTLVAEKSPLMFAGSSVGVGTITPEAKLQVISTPQDPNGNTLILGPVAQTNLRLGYHTDYSWIQSHNSRPLAINAIGNNVGIGTAAPGAKLTISSDSSHLQLRREPNAGAGKMLYLELYQGDTPNPVYPVLRFHHSNVFWHRIEGRPEGLMFKTGDLNSDNLINVYANEAILNALQIGGVTIGANELRVLQRLAAGQLQFDLWNVIQNEYAYAADYSPFDNDRRHVFTWRRKGERVSQGRWQISFPG